MPAFATLARVAAIAGMAALMGACPGPPKDVNTAEKCRDGLENAYDELDFAKAKGFGGTVAWTQAASLLSAASIQKEFGKYPNCVDKIRRARYYIQQSQL